MKRKIFFVKIFKSNCVFHKKVDFEQFFLLFDTKIKYILNFCSRSCNQNNTTFQIILPFKTNKMIGSYHLTWKINSTWPKIGVWR